MNRGTLAAATLAVALALAAGYQWGSRGQPTAGAAPASQERQPLFYRNPMGLPDTSPVPKKDPMGMDYIPVFAGEEAPGGNPNELRISSEKVQKLGVRSEAAAMRSLDQIVRAAGRVEVDERRVFAVAPKFEGWVEKLHVNATGQPVGKGQPLFEVYSPELVSAQREYALAMQGVQAVQGADAQAGMRALADASLARLKNWDISDEQIRALASGQESRRTLTFRSPVAGVVTEKKALQGMRFMPGEALYQIADLSSVWVLADVFEQDIGLVRAGASATLRINAYPGKTFAGRIAYVYPTLNAETRTVPVRVELANPGGLLKPSMFAEVELAAAGSGKVLTVPGSAVIDSGTRRIVLVDGGEGRFEPREVKLGRRSDSYLEILEGVRDGEKVVVAANFLIDAESNLKAAIGGFGHASHGGAPKPEGKGVGHQAQGVVEGIDAQAGMVSLKHGPVASLGWPAMTMSFKVANAALLAQLKPGEKVAVEFVERAPGEWVVTAVKPMAHSGH